MTTSESLPEFKYHPDPVGTGEVCRSDSECIVCGRRRGYVYVSAPYTAVDDDLHERICPWCIASGDAAQRYNAHFANVDDCFEEVADSEAKTELLRRTPGYIGWQDNQWRAHCGDFCAYLGRVGGAELREYGDEVCRQVFPDLAMTFSSIEEALDGLNKVGDTTGYLFRCLKCGHHRLHWDMC